MALKKPGAPSDLGWRMTSAALRRHPYENIYDKDDKDNGNKNKKRKRSESPPTKKGKGGRKTSTSRPAGKGKSQNLGKILIFSCNRSRGVAGVATGGRNPMGGWNHVGVARGGKGWVRGGRSRARGGKWRKGGE